MRSASLGSPVLVVTRLDDVTGDLVVMELGKRGVPVVRLDPGDFPGAVTVSATFGGRGMAGTLRTASRNIALHEIRSVYWRRPGAYDAPGLEAQDARWCVEQARFGLGGILASLPGAHYVNHPHRNRDAEYKPIQLSTAAQCGLTVPVTLVTNDPVEARRFASRAEPVIYKPLWNGDYFGADGRAQTVWVEEVDPSTLDGGVSVTTHLFQERVKKVADVRVTAVGRELFAVRIDGARGLDWRREYDALSYTLVAVPSEVIQGIGRYLDTFGLVFGAFDFGLDVDGQWWFYECNPNGQWAWFPDRITDCITVALAEQLQFGGRDDP
ncbi:ATP-grasp ribosomal peptide maturase [Embleya sp. MST-111070]|uniref:ATP-grasp ribosomal peptide maturase n=1 Tax=Embleya sp. MST-111070 TaxID=3398231 RepID=UPI003F73171F